MAKHVKSNAIVYARDGQTLGVGAGQMSRVDAAKFGAMKAVLPLANSAVASDAFFPFPDGLEAVATAGATAVIQPGGSVRDQEVIDAANRLNLAMVFTGCDTSGTDWGLRGSWPYGKRLFGAGTDMSFDAENDLNSEMVD